MKIDLGDGDCLDGFSVLPPDPVPLLVSLKAVDPSHCIRFTGRRSWNTADEPAAGSRR